MAAERRDIHTVLCIFVEFILRDNCGIQGYIASTCLIKFQGPLISELTLMPHQCREDNVDIPS